MESLKKYPHNVRREKREISRILYSLKEEYI
jgi:hypothetical protein